MSRPTVHQYDHGVIPVLYGAGTRTCVVLRWLPGPGSQASLLGRCARAVVMRHSCRLATGQATPRRTWIHPGRVPRHRAGPGRTRARRWPRVRCGAGWRGRLPRSPGSTSSPAASEDIRVSSTSHRGSPTRPRGARHDLHVASENPVRRRLLRTGRPRAGSRRSGWAGSQGKDHLPVLHAAAGAARHLEDSGAAAVRLHLQCPAPADLHRQPAQLRIQEVGVLA